ncbi:hypothetical protein [Bacillus salipaludis]|uniref:Uncharacterized protein n=1 Tax=Bacillus salipaludis TaxID=2547811 RepID=A0ABW8RFP1_9BACI
MKRQFFMIFFLFFAAAAPGSAQASSDIIRDGKAGGYEYTITLGEGPSYSWKIGRQGKIVVVEENSEKVVDLTEFMDAVNHIHLEKFKLISYTVYLMIIFITTLFIYFYNKKMLKSGGFIMVLFTAYALYLIIGAAVDLNRALDDARFYYLTLKQ